MAHCDNVYLCLRNSQTYLLSALWNFTQQKIKTDLWVFRVEMIHSLLPKFSMYRSIQTLYRKNTITYILDTLKVTEQKLATIKWQWLNKNQIYPLQQERSQNSIHLVNKLEYLLLRGNLSIWQHGIFNVKCSSLLHKNMTSKYSILQIRYM